MYICMRIFGLLWTGRYNMFHGKRCSFDLCTVHCCIVLLSVWFLVFRYFAHYDSTDKYGSELFRKISWQLSDLQFACGITTTVYFNHKHIPSFIKLWENYKVKHGGVSFAEMKRNILIRAVSINVMTIGLSFTCLIFGLIKEPEIVADTFLPALKRFNYDRPLWLVIVASVCYIYLAVAWVQPLIICLSVNKNLQEEFKQLSSQFSDEMQGTKGFHLLTKVFII